MSIILEFFSFNSYVLDFGLEGGVLGLGLGSCGLGLGLGLEVCVLGLALALGVMSLLTSLGGICPGNMSKGNVRIPADQRVRSENKRRETPQLVNVTLTDPRGE